MRIPFLYGEYPLTIDPKNRILVPAEIRKRIDPSLDGEALFLTMRGKIPWMYPEKYYEELASSQLPPDMAPTEDLIDYMRLRFAMASRVEWDNQGRIVLPESVLKRAGLDKEIKDVTLIGMRDHLELYIRSEWNDLRVKTEENAANIEGKAKSSRPNNVN